MIARILFCCCVLCHGSRMFADELGADIQAALTANAAALNGIEIEGYRERKFLIDANAGLKEIRNPESEKDFTERVPFTIKLLGPKIYWSQRFPKGDFHSGTAINERSFDGTKLFTGVGDPKGNRFNPGILMIDSPQTWKDDDAKRHRAVSVFDIPYLGAAGFTGSVFASDLGHPIRSLLLAQISAGNLLGVTQTETDGSRLVNVTVRYPEPWASSSRAPLETELSEVPASSRKRVRFQRELDQLHQDLIGKMRESTFTFDPAMNYAVREIREGRVSEPIMFHTKCGDFVKVDGTGLWLPRKCEIFSSTYELRPNYAADRPIYVTQLSVTEIKKNKVADDEFAIWYDEPGTAVADSTHEKASEGVAFEYMVPASEEDLNRFVWGGSTSWFIFASLLVGVAIIGALTWRRFRRSRIKQR